MGVAGRLTSASHHVCRFSARVAAMVVLSLGLSGCLAPPCMQPMTMSSPHGGSATVLLDLVWAPTASGGPPLLVEGVVPSRPGDISRTVTQEQWWQERCRALPTRSADAPDAGSGIRLLTVQPFLDRAAGQSGNSDWQRDAACFGITASDYFLTARMLYESLVTSAHYQILPMQAGKTISKQMLLEQLGDYGRDGAVILQCHTDAAGRSVLRELVFSIDLASITWFPAPVSLKHAEGVQDTCPDTFLIPDR